MNQEEPKLAAKKRNKLGTAECRRLRRQGVVPGNMYGHGVDPLALAVSEETLAPIVQAGEQVVDLDIEGKVQKAIFREIQWDTFDQHIEHFDLVRVDADERVSVDVPVELRGVSPGVVAGGVMDQHLHSLSIDCLINQIPNEISVRISDLEIGDSVHVRDLEVPPGSEVNHPEDELVVQVTEAVEVEEEVPEEEVTEPELIQREEGEEGEASEEES